MYLLAFLLVTALLWVSLFGYPLMLFALSKLRRRRKRPEPGPLPSVAVVVPTLNEERFIQSKLSDLLETKYPTELISFFVIDGGSSDRTVELAELEGEAFSSLQVVPTPGAVGKSDQINQIVPTLEEEVLVVTDVDTRLHPECIRELVRLLEEDSRLGVAGATVLPVTELLEERIHWGLQNRLWWLEGEALSASVVCAACYAVRRSVFSKLPLDTIAEDARMALSAGMHGYGSRVSREAIASELRVPQTLTDFLEFRQRRGSDYLSELQRLGGRMQSLRWRLMTFFRRWAFSSVAIVSLLWFVLGGVALFNSGLYWILLAIGLLGFSTLLSFSFFIEDLKSAGPIQLAISLVRFLVLIWLSLLWIKILSMVGDKNASEKPSQYDAALS